MAAERTDEATSAARCESCGRFLGPYTTCPYCGARVKGRIPLRAIKVIAVLLALAGLLLLWWIARRTPVPLLTVEQAQGTMNMAYVRLQGRITRSLTYDPVSGYLAFWVDDGTGEARVSAYRDVTAKLLAAGVVPAPGDEVELSGTLRVREDFVALTLNLAEHLRLERPAPVAARAGAITAADAGLRVRLEGEVERIWVPYEGLTLITLRDETGEIPVVVDESLIALTGALPEVLEGQTLVVTGTVTLYRDEPQLSPASVTELRFSSAPPLAAALPTPTPKATPPSSAPPPLSVTLTLPATATPAPTEIPPTPTATPLPPRALNTLNAAEAGAWVQVRGRIVAMTGIKGGLKAVLDDATGQLVLILWQRLYDALPVPTAVDVGAEIEIAGQLSLYEGVLELEPQSARDLSVRTAAPEIPWVALSSLSAQDAGRIVRLRGVTGIPEPFSAGVKLPLDDGFGVITVLLWSNVAETLPQPPEAGMTLEVVGEVSVYRDALELIPRSAHDWRPGP
ncbi:MAG: hypothetical protein RBT75_01545 [Anaerolineae bacterium]|nr:hypothetical protein [Anaerolineae bacterium]